MSLWAIPTDYISKYCECAQCHCWVDGSTQWSESRGSTFFWCLRLGNMGMCTACAAYAYLWSMIYLCTLEQQRSCGNVIGDSRPLLHCNLHQICLVRRQPKLTWTQHANPHIFFNMKCECRTTNINTWFIVGTRWNSSFFSVTLNSWKWPSFHTAFLSARSRLCRGETLFSGKWPRSKEHLFTSLYTTFIGCLVGKKFHRSSSSFFQFQDQVYFSSAMILPLSLGLPLWSLT